MAEKTYFVRHTPKGSIGPTLRDMFFQKKLFGLHYQNICETDPTKYEHKKAKEGMEILNKIARDGGFICSTYWGVQGCLIGKVLPGTEIICKKGANFDEQKPDVIYKTLLISGSKHVCGANHIRLMAVRPPSLTICRWGAVKERVAKLLTADDVEVQTVDDLLPFEQEIMCAEYLRRKVPGLPQLNCLTTSVGGTQEALDIFGKDTQSKWVSAQVTNYAPGNARLISKAEALRQYGCGALIMFCNCEEGYADGSQILWVSLKSVWREMTKDKTFCEAFNIITQ